MQQKIVKETFQLVSKRDDNVCNFLEGGRSVTMLTIARQQTNAFGTQSNHPSSVLIVITLQLNWWLGLQAHLPTLRHTIFCLLRRFQRVWTRYPRLDSGMLICDAVALLLFVFFLNIHEFAATLGLRRDPWQMLRERLRAWLNFPCRQGIVSVCSPCKCYRIFARIGSSHLERAGHGWHGVGNKYERDNGENRRPKPIGKERGMCVISATILTVHWQSWLITCLLSCQAGISAAPSRAVSAVKSMNIPQQIKVFFDQTLIALDR